MQMQRIIKAFVCVFTIAPLLSGGGTSSEVIPDMTKFLNTSDPIWSYMTTSTRRDYDCKVDVIDSIQDTKVLFRRFLGYRKVIMSDWVLFLNGRLYYNSARRRNNGPIYNAMNVSFREHGNSLDNEKLIYQNMNNTCGILEVTDLAHAGHGITYELRVKNSSIERANETDCFKVYKNGAES
uniref:Putative lipocalin n=1 Tax=Rhipicephalus microplus TaxID=6941 RepID=A0A6G5A6H6_RHIMP